MWFQHTTTECIKCIVLMVSVTGEGNSLRLDGHILNRKWHSMFHIMITLQFKKKFDVFFCYMVRGHHIATS